MPRSVRPSIVPVLLFLAGLGPGLLAAGCAKGGSGWRPGDGGPDARATTDGQAGDANNERSDGNLDGGDPIDADAAAWDGGDGGTGSGADGGSEGGPDGSADGAPTTCRSDAECDDGLVCNGDERCDPSAPEADPSSGCVPGTPPDCDDGVVCTTDACDEARGGCVHDSRDADGDERCDAQDCDETDPDVYVGAPERCNALDDDCDGAIDEDFDCVQGGSGSCTTGCGTTGTRACSASCSWGACTASEACNGCDDDVDGATDEDFTCTLGATRSCSVDGCPGTQRCEAGCAWGSCDLGAAPANDGCGGSVPTIDRSGTFPFATCAATNDWGASCGGGAASPDLVYRLEVAVRSTVTLETTGSSFDTVLHLRSGASCPGTELACDDDGGAGSHSRIQRTLDPGTYWVVVDGSGSSSRGDGTLRVTIAPVNDECGGALPVTLSTGRTTVAGSTVAASDSAFGCGGSAPDLWYRFTLSRTEVVDINTFGSGYDTYLGLFTSCGSVSGSRCNDDACSTSRSRVTAVLPPGTYYVKVDGFSTRSGTFQLHLEHLPTGSDGTATPVGSGTNTYSGTTSGGSVRSSRCGGGSAPEDLLYWTECPSNTGHGFSASTCELGTGYDTMIHLWSGVSGAEMTCNDDSSCFWDEFSSEITASIPSGFGLYGLYVDGFGSSAGSYEVTTSR